MDETIVKLELRLNKLKNENYALELAYRNKTLYENNLKENVKHLEDEYNMELIKRKDTEAFKKAFDENLNICTNLKYALLQIDMTSFMNAYYNISKQNFEKSCKRVDQHAQNMRSVLKNSECVQIYQKIQSKNKRIKEYLDKMRINMETFQRNAEEIRKCDVEYEKQKIIYLASNFDKIINLQNKLKLIRDETKKIIDNTRNSDTISNPGDSENIPLVADLETPSYFIPTTLSKTSSNLLSKEEIYNLLQNSLKEDICTTSPKPGKVCVTEDILLIESRHKRMQQASTNSDLSVLMNNQIHNNLNSDQIETAPDNCGSFIACLDKDLNAVEIPSTNSFGSNIDTLIRPNSEKENNFNPNPIEAALEQLIKTDNDGLFTSCLNKVINLKDVDNNIDDMSSERVAEELSTLSNTNNDNLMRTISEKENNFNSNPIEATIKQLIKTDNDGVFTSCLNKVINLKDVDNNIDDMSSERVADELSTLNNTNNDNLIRTISEKENNFNSNPIEATLEQLIKTDNDGVFTSCLNKVINLKDVDDNIDDMSSERVAEELSTFNNTNNGNLIRTISEKENNFNSNPIEATLEQLIKTDNDGVFTSCLNKVINLKDVDNNIDDMSSERVADELSTLNNTTLFEMLPETRKGESQDLNAMQILSETDNNNFETPFLDNIKQNNTEQASQMDNCSTPLETPITNAIYAERDMPFIGFDKREIFDKLPMTNSRKRKVEKSTIDIQTNSNASEWQITNSSEQIESNNFHSKLPDLYYNDYSDDKNNQMSKSSDSIKLNNPKKKLRYSNYLESQGDNLLDFTYTEINSNENELDIEASPKLFNYNNHKSKSENTSNKIDHKQNQPSKVLELSESNTNVNYEIYTDTKNEFKQLQSRTSRIKTFKNIKNKPLRISNRLFAKRAEIESQKCKNIDNELQNCKNIDNELQNCKNIDNELQNYNNIDNELQNCKNIENELQNCKNIDNELQNCKNIDNELQNCKNIDNDLQNCKNIDNELQNCKNIENDSKNCKNIIKKSSEPVKKVAILGQSSIELDPLVEQKFRKRRKKRQSKVNSSASSMNNFPEKINVQSSKQSSQKKKKQQNVRRKKRALDEKEKNKFTPIYNYENNELNNHITSSYVCEKVSLHELQSPQNSFGFDSSQEFLKPTEDEDECVSGSNDNFHMYFNEVLKPSNTEIETDD